MVSIGAADSRQQAWPGLFNECFTPWNIGPGPDEDVKP
jgi:hypothetical protein